MHLRRYTFLHPFGNACSCGELDLGECANVFIGDESIGMKGISGGQVRHTKVSRYAPSLENHFKIYSHREVAVISGS